MYYILFTNRLGVGTQGPREDKPPLVHVNPCLYHVHFLRQCFQRDPLTTQWSSFAKKGEFVEGRVED